MHSNDEFIDYVPAGRGPTDIIARLACGCLLHRGLPEGGPFLSVRGCIVHAAKSTLAKAEDCHEYAMEAIKRKYGDNQ